jgi:hypothetical protein
VPRRRLARSERVAGRPGRKEAAVSVVGHYRLALHPGAVAAELETLLSSLRGENILQLTRVTSGFSERVLTGYTQEGNPTPGPHYIWEVTVRLVTDVQYDFADSAERVQQAVAEYATLVSVEGFREAAQPEIVG